MTARESHATARAGSPAKDKSESPPDPAGAGAKRNILLAVALATVVLAVATVWSVPRPTGDLYVGLAAGEDIMAGKMGKVDDWAFTTEGRVWINQNWGTNLLYWVSYELGGEAGLLVLKALIIMTGALFLILACRRRDADWPVALIVAAGVIAAGRSFIDLRPNLTTLMFVPVMLHVLYRTAEKPHRIWLTMLVFGVIWANLHGGFTLGLLAMFFWATCVVILPMLGRQRLSAWVPGVAIAASVAASLWYISDETTSGAGGSRTAIPPKYIWAAVGFAASVALWYLIRRKVAAGSLVILDDGGVPVAERVRRHLRSKWPYLAAAMGTLVLAGVVTPFGIHNALRDFSKLSMPFWEMWNLTHPYVVTFGQDSEVWRSVIEWHSIFTASPGTFGTSWEFFGIVGLFCTLVPLSVAVRIGQGKLLDVEDFVLLAVIVGLCVVIVAQAAPVHGDFGRLIDNNARFDRGFSPDVLRGVRQQYYGWLAVLIVYPLIGLFAVGVSIAAISAWMVRRQTAPWSAERIGIVVFDVCMAMGGIKMAFGARRFMPLALMLLAPLLARRMQWLVGWLGDIVAGVEAPARAKARQAGAKPPLTTPRGLIWHLPTLIIGLAVMAVIGKQAAANYNRYRTDSPLVRYSSVLKNMIVYQMFPPHAKDFILANDLSGRCFNEWRWEGYLRWYCPKLQVFIGGRAQQAYSIETYKIQRDVIAGSVPLSRLQEFGVRWVIVPMSGSYVPFLRTAASAPGAVWVPIFYDGENIILANSRLPECQDVIRRCLASALKYPRDSKRDLPNEAYAALSRGMCLSSALINRPQEALAEIKKAQQLEPIPMSYALLGDLYSRAGTLGQGEINYLESENRRLEQMDWRRLDGFEILRCRYYVLSLLDGYYRQIEQPSQASRVAAEMTDLDALMGRVLEEWD
jgi:hypothetical protein